jgi:hypothetical protein
MVWDCFFIQWWNNRDNNYVDIPHIYIYIYTKKTPENVIKVKTMVMFLIKVSFISDLNALSQIGCTVEPF